jgi:hypothetical protein
MESRFSTEIKGARRCRTWCKDFATGSRPLAEGVRHNCGLVRGLVWFHDDFYRPQRGAGQVIPNRIRKLSCTSCYPLARNPVSVLAKQKRNFLSYGLRVAACHHMSLGSGVKYNQLIKRGFSDFLLRITIQYRLEAKSKTSTHGCSDSRKLQRAPDPWRAG